MFKAYHKFMPVSFIALAIGLSSQVHAQYVGPNQAVVSTTVAEILKNPVDDQEVVLQGQIIRKIKKKHYEFKDKTGTIRAEIDNKYFYNDKITDKTLVEIYGEVDKNFSGNPEIDVKKLTIITP